MKNFSAYLLLLIVPIFSQSDGTPVVVSCLASGQSVGSQFIEQKAILPVYLYKRPFQKDTVVHLNNWHGDQSSHYIGFSNPVKSFNYQQVAQYFKTERQAVLKDLRIQQLFFNINKLVSQDSVGVEGGFEQFPVSTSVTAIQGSYIHSKSTDFMTFQHSIFKLRIYATSADGAPGEDLCKETIEIRTPTNENIIVNLKKYAIRVPEGGFYIAIEWLKRPENLSLVKNINLEGFKKQDYRPFIGVRKHRGSKLNVFGMDDNGKWQPLSFISPHYTDLCISVSLVE